MFSFFAICVVVGVVAIFFKGALKMINGCWLIFLFKCAQHLDEKGKFFKEVAKTCIRSSTKEEMLL